MQNLSLVDKLRTPVSGLSACDNMQVIHHLSASLSLSQGFLITYFPCTQAKLLAALLNQLQSLGMDYHYFTGWLLKFAPKSQQEMFLSTTACFPNIFPLLPFITFRSYLLFFSLLMLNILLPFSKPLCPFVHVNI